MCTEKGAISEITYMIKKEKLFQTKMFAKMTMVIYNYIIDIFYRFSWNIWNNILTRSPTHQSALLRCHESITAGWPGHFLVIVSSYKSGQFKHYIEISSFNQNSLTFPDFSQNSLTFPVLPNFLTFPGFPGQPATLCSFLIDASCRFSWYMFEIFIFWIH